MKKNTAIMIGLALAVSAFTVVAQPGPGRGRGQGGRGGGPAGGPHRFGAQQLPPPIAATFDADRDGVLSDVEINAAAPALLKLDTNKDGQLSAEELCAGPGQGGQDCPVEPPGRGQGRGQGRGPGAQVMQGLIGKLFDADSDGALTSMEIAAASDVLVKLDKNGDGKVTADELRPRSGGGGRGPRWAR